MEALKHPALRAIVLFWTVVLLVRLWVAADLGLAADEAYYWLWSENLAWGYFDHPPGVAAWIAASTSVFGNSELGVRGLGLLLQSLMMIVLVWEAAQSERSDPLLLSVLLVCPLFALGGVLTTPDAPLLVAWAGGIVAARRQAWVWLGVFAGLAMLSKFTGYLLLPAVAFAYPRLWPHWLKSAGIALVVVLPNWIWIASNDWISFRFQLEHGFAHQSGGIASLLEGVGSQALVVGPFFFLAGIVWWWAQRGVKGLYWWLAVVPATAFLLSSVRGVPEANWMAPAWLGVALGLSESQGRLRRLAWIGAMTGAFASLLVFAHAMFSIFPLPKDPVDRLRVGQDIATEVESVGAEPVVCQRYQEAAWLAYYAGLKTTTLPEFGRQDQFDYWPRPNLSEALYLRPFSQEPLEAEVYWEDIGAPTRFVVDREKLGPGRWEYYRVAKPR